MLQPQLVKVEAAGRRRRWRRGDESFSGEGMVSIYRICWGKEGEIAELKGGGVRGQ